MDFWRGYPNFIRRCEDITDSVILKKAIMKRNSTVSWLLFLLFLFPFPVQEESAGSCKKGNREQAEQDP